MLGDGLLGGAGEGAGGCCGSERVSHPSVAPYPGQAWHRQWPQPASQHALPQPGSEPVPHSQGLRPPQSTSRSAKIMSIFGNFAYTFTVAHIMVRSLFLIGVLSSTLVMTK